MTDNTIPDIQWPNQNEVVDGVVPVNEVSQDPKAFEHLSDEELEREMEI
jgi:hypothetical protein